MQVNKVSEEGDFTALPDPMEFKKGDAVYDVAWQAYCTALEAEGKQPPERPEPSNLRLAFPPST